MNYHYAVNQVKTLLTQLRNIDFGYPLGDNILREPSVGIFPADGDEIAEFYCYCDGLSWPDVANGYFIYKRADFGMAKNEYDPTSIEGDLGGEISVLGSTGTGVLFARRNEDGRILSLPPSKIKANVYDNTDSRAKVVAGSLNEFFLKLTEDLNAFVEDEAGHSYLA